MFGSRRLEGRIKQDIHRHREPRQGDALAPEHLGTATLCVTGACALQACCLEVIGVAAGRIKRDFTQQQENYRVGRIRGDCGRLDKFIVVG
jgi:hypothetical protein